MGRACVVLMLARVGVPQHLVTTWLRAMVQSTLVLQVGRQHVRIRDQYSHVRSKKNMNAWMHLGFNVHSQKERARSTIFQ